MDKIRKNGVCIKSNEKHYRNLAKNYRNPYSALNELTDNAIYAKNCSRVHLEFTKYNYKDLLLTINDGEFFKQNDLSEAIGNLGSHSAETPGNQNGNGIKGASSYFQKTTDSFTAIISKSTTGKFSYGLISCNGEVFTNPNDFSSFDLKFFDCLKKSLEQYPEGTALGVYNARKIDDENLPFFNVKKNINKRYTSRLERVNFTVKNTSSGDFERVGYEDYFYKNNPLLQGNDVRFTEDVAFDWNTKDGMKTFRATLEVLCVKNIEGKIEEQNIYDCQDGLNKFYGFMCGYDDGWMPVTVPGMGLLGLDARHQYNLIRGRLIAHPSNNGNDANVRHWQEFYDEYTGLDSTKVQANQVCTKVHRKIKGKDEYGAEKAWQSYYTNVVKVALRKFNDWKSTTDDSDDAKKYDINTKLPNEDFTIDNLNVKFNFSAMDEDKFVAADHKSDNECMITFNFKHKFWAGYSKKTDKVLNGNLKGAFSAYANTFKTFTYGKPANGAKRLINYFCKKLNNTMK